MHERDRLLIDHERSFAGGKREDPLIHRALEAQGALTADQGDGRTGAPFAGGRGRAKIRRHRHIAILGPNDLVRDRRGLGFFLRFIRGGVAGRRGFYGEGDGSRQRHRQRLGPRGKRRLQRRQFAGDRLDARLLLGVGEQNDRAGLGDVSIPTTVGEAFEERAELVVFALGERIKFVVVTRCTVSREAEPHGGGGVGAVPGVARLSFGFDGAAFGSREMRAVVAGRDELIDARLREQIAGELFEGELVVG